MVFADASQASRLFSLLQEKREKEVLSMTYAKRALEAITPYLSRMSTKQRRVERTHVWLDVILRAEGYDRKATAEADPSDTNEIAVFVDGSRLWLNPFS